MITLDDFGMVGRSLYNKYTTGINGDLVAIQHLDWGWFWWVQSSSTRLTRPIGTPKFATAQEALDDLLACDNPVAVQALKAVFGDKHEEPTP